MPRSLAVTIRMATAFLALVGLAVSGFARERGPRVEVVCPFDPVPVRMGKQQILAYELHVTNFDMVALRLKSVEVFGDQETGAPLSTLTDDRLSAAMTLAGSGMAGMGGMDEKKNNRLIQPGARAVVFMWIELPLDRFLPGSLRHRMVFTPTEGNAADATLQDFPVTVSRDSVPTLSPPFNGGTWLAGDGPVNDSPHRQTITAIDGHIYSAERFAIDWIKVGPNGDSTHDGKTRNENWWGYGEPVLAVADGEITEVVDGIPDNTPRNLPPVTLDNIAGNHVILQIAPSRFVTYAHLQNGSIKVRLHQRVHRGDVLGLLGNSGNATGPHLHLQVTDRNSVLESQGVPFVFANFTYLGPGSEYELNKHVSVPWEKSIPPGNAVVTFEPLKK